jgi:4'-phosphopantetheinyl transferase
MLTGIAQDGKPTITVISFTAPPLAPELLAQLLCPGELERAERFRFPHLRERFRVGRGMLRSLLAKHCGTAAQQLRFEYSEYGKPSLRGFPDCTFNVSHSGDLWACAIGSGSAFGIDIEHKRPLPDRDALAHRFFAPAEHQAINAYPEADRSAAFYRCWTRKEAYLKALGFGLSKGLASFEVSCSEAATSAICDRASSDQWFAHDLQLPDGYAGALVLAARGPDTR